MEYKLRLIFWALMTMLALLLFLITAEYLTFRTDLNFLQKKQDVIHTIWLPVFYVHVISSMAVIAVGPFQFLKKFRSRYLNWHRLGGKIYAYGILLLAAPSGLIMAFYAEAGFWSVIGFLCMGILWFVTTLMAVIKIKQRKIEEHRIWMIRSYALSFAAITLRLLVPFFSLFIYDENLIIISTAWLSWLLNLLIAEGMIFAIQHKSNKLNITT